MHLYIAGALESEETEVKTCPICLSTFDDHVRFCPFHGVGLKTIPEHHFAPGDTIGGYYLQNRILSDGLGDIYRATKGDNNYRIRLFSEAILSEPEKATQLLDTLDKNHTLTGAGIPVLDYDWYEDGALYAASPLIQGCTFQNLLDSGISLSENDIADLLYQLLRSIKDIHAQGMIHGNLSLNNTIIDGAGHIRFYDTNLWSLLRLGDFTSLRADRPELFDDILDFMAPEVVNGEPAQEFSDVFSCGAMIRKMIMASSDPASHAKRMEMHLVGNMGNIKNLQTKTKISSDFLEVLSSSMVGSYGVRFQTPQAFINALQSIHSEIDENADALHETRTERFLKSISDASQSSDPNAQNTRLIEQTIMGISENKDAQAQKSESKYSSQSDISLAVDIASLITTLNPDVQIPLNPDSGFNISEGSAQKAQPQVEPQKESSQKPQPQSETPKKSTEKPQSQVSTPVEKPEPTQSSQPQAETNTPSKDSEAQDSNKPHKRIGKKKNKTGELERGDVVSMNSADIKRVKKRRRDPSDVEPSDEVITATLDIAKAIHPEDLPDFSELPHLTSTGDYFIDDSNLSEKELEKRKAIAAFAASIKSKNEDKQDSAPAKDESEHPHENQSSENSKSDSDNSNDDDSPYVDAWFNDDQSVKSPNRRITSLLIAAIALIGLVCVAVAYYKSTQNTNATQSSDETAVQQDPRLIAFQEELQKGTLESRKKAISLFHELRNADTDQDIIRKCRRDLRTALEDQAKVVAELSKPAESIQDPLDITDAENKIQNDYFECIRPPVIPPQEDDQMQLPPPPTPEMIENKMKECDANKASAMLAAKKTALQNARQIQPSLQEQLDHWKELADIYSDMQSIAIRDTIALSNSISTSKAEVDRYQKRLDAITTWDNELNANNAMIAANAPQPETAENIQPETTENTQDDQNAALNDTAQNTDQSGLLAANTTNPTNKIEDTKPDNTITNPGNTQQDNTKPAIELLDTDYQAQNKPADKPAENTIEKPAEKPMNLKSDTGLELLNVHDANANNTNTDKDKPNVIAKNDNNVKNDSNTRNDNNVKNDSNTKNNNTKQDTVVAKNNAKEKDDSPVIIIPKTVETPKQTINEAPAANSNAVPTGKLIADANAAMSKRDFTTAVALLEQATKQEPRNHRAWLSMAKANENLGKLILATTEAERSCEISKSAGCYVYLGDLHKKAGNLNDAREAYSTALQIDPNNAAAKAKLQ